MDKDRIYFIGIGGIGMSALARYFLETGWHVGGYDRTQSGLTDRLVDMGAKIHYEDGVYLIPEEFLDVGKTAVVYTPAIPPEHTELKMFREHGFEVMKRSQMLGILSQGKYVMAVAGTHGKTTTSTLVAWLNHRVLNEGSAFLGGVSKNFGGNLVSGKGVRLAVEADEFDRSFLRLYPDVAVVTSADADHLDIYGTHEAVKEAFAQFISQIKVGGSLVIKKGVDVAVRNESIKVWTYSYDEPCDFYAKNVSLVDGGYYRYDIVTPSGIIEGCTLGIPGWINIENSIAAVAAFWCSLQHENRDLDCVLLKSALSEFAGVKRRFELYINTPEQVYIDDYAHHPRELSATITSVRKMFPGRRLTVVFQPHLYTRTRDLYIEFASSLSLADEVVLLPIYPAREEPIDGVSSQMIADLVTVPCRIVPKYMIAGELGSMNTDVVISFGAGDIDACCGAISQELGKKCNF